MTLTPSPPELWNGIDEEAWEVAGRLLVAPDQESDGKPLPSIRASLEDLVQLHRLSARDLASPFPLAKLLHLGSALLQGLYHGPAGDSDREAVRQAADAWRRELVGETVTYVVNRNLNASNHCVLHCAFCAFRRSEGEEGAYRLTRSALKDRAAEARALGATELCLQAGLDPQASRKGSHLEFAATLLADLKEAAPGLHLHGFSPQELLFLAQQDGVPLQQVVDTLRDAGLGSVPGTAAEVLVPRVRRLICPEKLSARAWVAVIRQLHQANVPTTSTMLAGHVETPLERLAHLCTLGALQREACLEGHTGFTEFILLPFVGASAPPPLRARVGRDQPDASAMLLLTAHARLVLGPWIRHHQSSWVKLTLPIAAEALDWGCDDLGGTLMEEHISTMAGAMGGTQQTADALRAAAVRHRRPVRQRTTLYGGVGAPRRSP